MAVAALSVVFLAVGFVWPGLAGRLLLTLIPVLAFAYAGSRVYRAALPLEMSSDVFTPFDRSGANPTVSATPAVIRGLSSQLRAVDDPETARLVPIPSAAHRTLVAEITRRLSERHGLNALEPADHDRIRTLVSEPTWDLVRPAEGDVRTLAFRNPVLLDHIATILDDAERL